MKVFGTGPWTSDSSRSFTAILTTHLQVSFNKAQRPTMRLHAFWAYPLIEMREMRGGNLSQAIAPFGGEYARELF